ncbi:MAG: hypothetical protein COB17_11545 [Sulfurimonas sp.]|nr:MAG: hypothetical protein COB17_11545 [Sulfurimonas sp.]
MHIDYIILEMKIVHLQLQLAKKSVKKLYTLHNTQAEVELHIDHSLEILNRIIYFTDDFKTEAESKHSACNRIKEIS